MAGNRSGVAQALVALRHADYRRFAASLLLTSLGAQLLQAAIFWQVYVLTGSALQLGLTGVARAVPHMLLSLAGGVIADRTNRVRLIQAGQVANALLVAALAAVTISGHAQVWHLYAATFLNSAFTAITQPARTALIPRLIPERNLVNAIALNATISQLAQIVGPALAGIVIARLDTGAAYALNALLYLAAMASIHGVRAPSTPEPTAETPWRSFMDGLAFVRRRRVIVSLLGLDLAETVFGSYRALLPILATSIGAGVVGYGLLGAAPGVGAVLGAAGMLALGDVRYKGIYTIAGVLGYCVALVALALAPWFWLALAAAALLGAANAIQVIPRNSAILMMSPDALRGRVEAFRSMLAGGGPPVGYAVSGALGAVFGAPLALVIGAGLCVAIVAAIGAGDRELRDPDLGARRDADRPAPSSNASIVS